MLCSLWLVTSCEHKSVSLAMELAVAYDLKEALPLAGKVHGSLARAGKVRGQTPKVQKQDKKKQPKGRAMKRIKYNRRFVNVGKSTMQFILPFSRPLGLPDTLLYGDISDTCVGDSVDSRDAAAIFRRAHEIDMPDAAFYQCVMAYIACAHAVVGFGKKKGPNSQ